MQRLRSRIGDCPRCTGVSVGRHAEIFMPRGEQRVWSPWLSVTAESEKGGAIVHGRFAPHPHVWTFYIFITFALGLATLGGVTWSYAQWATGSTPWARLSLPLGLSLYGLLYVISLAGQRLSHDQLEHLEEALMELIAAEPGPPPAD